MGEETGKDQEPERSSGLRGCCLLRIFGCDVKVNLTWLFLALFIIWTLATGFLPTDYPALSAQTYWSMACIIAAGIFCSIIFHELAHSLIARRFGLPTKGITLFIFSGVAEMDDDPVSPKAEFLMAVAGLLASVLLAAMFYLVERLALLLDGYTAIIGTLHYLAMINLGFAMFNLIPAFPLDGGRMLRAALWSRKKDLHAATRLASHIGSGFGLGMMILGGTGFFLGNSTGGMGWFLGGAFLHAAANTSYRQLLIREMISEMPVRRFMNLQPVTVAPDITIKVLVEHYVKQHHYRRYPVVEGTKLIGCISTHEIEQIPEEEQALKSVGDLLISCSSANTVSPDSDAIKLLAEVSRPDINTLYMVVENEQLVGIISLNDLREIVAMKLKAINM